MSNPSYTVTDTRPGYELRSNGELWRVGEYPFLCGYVMNPENLDYAIDNFEEEARCLLAAAREEFGL